MIKVFVDANLLFYKLISDLLFDASSLGFIQAHWSQAVIDEYIEHGPRVLNQNRKKNHLPEDLKSAKDMVLKKIDLFKKHSGFILIEDYDSIQIPDKALNDKDDHHVLQAALKAECQVLLTLDKDFRKIKSIDDLQIVAQKADDFFCELFDKHERQMRDVIEQTRKGISRQKGNEIKYPQLIEIMKKGSLTELAKKIKHSSQQQ